MVSQIWHPEVKASKVTLGNLTVIFNVKSVEPLFPFQVVPEGLPS